MCFSTIVSSYKHENISRHLYTSQSIFFISKTKKSQYVICSSILKDGTTADNQQAAATKLTGRNKSHISISRQRLFVEKPLYPQMRDKSGAARVSILTTTPPQSPPQEHPQVSMPPQIPLQEPPQVTTLPKVTPQALSLVPIEMGKSRARPIMHQLLI